MHELRPPFSPVGMGGCPLGGHGWGESDDDQLRAAVRQALDLGVRHFDTADVYGLGSSESLLGETLGGDKAGVVLATKFGVRWDRQGRITRDTSPAYLRTALDDSLRRLRTERIDLYYAHWPDGTTPVEEVMGELERRREEGKIRWIGLSNHTADQLRRASTVGRVDALQVPYSLVDRGVALEVASTAVELGVPMITWGSLAQGLLTGKFDRSSTFEPDDRRSRYDNFQGERFLSNLRIADRVRVVAERSGASMACVALSWVLQQPGVASVLFGAKRPGQVRDNVAAGHMALSTADVAFLSEDAPIPPDVSATAR